MTARPADVRFWARVQKTAGCWLYNASPRRKRYGHVSVDGMSVYAHRYSWTLHHGPIPDGLWVLHRCDTPRCVNPEHLFLGTQQDNNHDMFTKGRGRGQFTMSTHCRRGHEYTAENTWWGHSKKWDRRCRECLRLQARTYRHARALSARLERERMARLDARHTAIHA